MVQPQVQQQEGSPASIPGPGIIPPPPVPYPSFIEELRDVLNRWGKDNDAATPDFILASFLDSTLTAYIHCMRWRDQWIGATPSPEPPPMPPPQEGNL